MAGNSSFPKRGELPVESAVDQVLFAGESAATADKEKLRAAIDLYAKGADRNQIWQDTGWFMGRDGKWRFEIPDINAEMAPGAMDRINRLNGQSDTTPLMRAGDHIQHNEFFKAYPGAAKRTSEGGHLDIAATGDDERSGMTMLFGRGGKTSNPQALTIMNKGLGSSMRNATLHELQHYIQRREGFAEGTSPEAQGGNTDQGFRNYLLAPGELEGMTIEFRSRSDDAYRKRNHPLDTQEWLEKFIKDNPGKRPVSKFK